MTLENEHVWCPIDLVLHIIGGKWTIPIIRDLFTGPKRPSELAKTLKGINPKTLTDRLRELEKWGLVKRTAFHEIPPRVEYSLTETGQQLFYVMQALREVGESWQHALNIKVPAKVREQCSHCFEYMHRVPEECATAATLPAACKTAEPDPAAVLRAMVVNPNHMPEV